MEVRQNERVFFQIQDGIRAVFEKPDLAEGCFDAAVMNLSEGGLGLLTPKTETLRIHEGDQYRLQKITGEPALSFIAEINTHIRWILDYETLENLVFGIEFIEPPEPITKKLREFILTCTT